MKTKLTFRIIAFLLCLASMSATKAQNVGINTDTPDNDAILEIYADDKGILIPRVSTFERNSSLPSPAAGMLIFNADSNRFNYYNGTEWVDLSAGWKHKVNGTPTSNFVHAALSAGERVGIGTETPSTKLEVAGTVTATTYNQQVGNAVVSGGIMPQGGIIMWSGTLNTIPEGWALCDGNNNQPINGLDIPNLSDRFIVSVGTYAIGATGGQNSVALTTAQIPAHSHTMNHSHSITDPGHTHSYDDVATNPENVAAVQGGGNNISSPPGVVSRTTVSDTTGITIDQHTGSTGNTGGAGGHENRPPFFALAFIIKL